MVRMLIESFTEWRMIQDHRKSSQPCFFLWEKSGVIKKTNRTWTGCFWSKTSAIENWFCCSNLILTSIDLLSLQKSACELLVLVKSFIYNAYTAEKNFCIKMSKICRGDFAVLFSMYFFDRFGRKFLNTIAHLMLEILMPKRTWSCVTHSLFQNFFCTNAWRWVVQKKRLASQNKKNTPTWSSPNFENTLETINCPIHSDVLCLNSDATYWSLNCLWIFASNMLPNKFSKWVVQNQPGTWINSTGPSKKI